MAQTPKEPKVQTFNLKPAETQTLAVLQQSHQQSFAALLSLLATERMGYPVTERTQFKLNQEFTSIEISELPEDVPVANQQVQSQQKPEEPKAGVVAAK